MSEDASDRAGDPTSDPTRDQPVEPPAPREPVWTSRANPRRTRR